MPHGARSEENDSLEIKNPPSLRPVTEEYIRALRAVGAREQFVRRVEKDRARLVAYLKKRNR